MLDLERGAVLPPVRADGAHAVRADGDHPAHPGRAQRFDIGLGELRDGQVVAQAAGRVAGAFLLAQHAERHARVAQNARQGQHRLAALRVVCAHAAEPQAVGLRAVVNRQPILLDETQALAGGEAESVPGALQVQEQPGAVFVLPLAGVYGGAPQSHDRRQVLDAHRTLKLAGAASRALEDGLFGNVPAQQRGFAGRSELVEVAAQAENDLLGLSAFPVLKAGNARCNGRIPRRCRPAGRRCG